VGIGTPSFFRNGKRHRNRIKSINTPKRGGLISTLKGSFIKIAPEYPVARHGDEWRNPIYGNGGFPHAIFKAILPTIPNINPLINNRPGNICSISDEFNTQTT
jgi:hypothetical protein